MGIACVGDFYASIIIRLMALEHMITIAWSESSGNSLIKIGERERVG